MYRSKLTPEEQRASRRKADVVAALQPTPAPFDEARLKKLLAMIMRTKEAHAEGEHEGAEDDFCPLCRSEKRAEVAESALMAAGRMRRTARFTNWILENPEQWERLRAAARAIKG